MRSAVPTPNRARFPKDTEDNALDIARERLRAERDRAICGAHRHGVPAASLARMTKISRARIAEILGS
jgi:hypothetical protein